MEDSAGITIAFPQNNETTQYSVINTRVQRYVILDQNSNGFEAILESSKKSQCILHIDPYVTSLSPYIHSQDEDTHRCAFDRHCCNYQYCG